MYVQLTEKIFSNTRTYEHTADAASIVEDK